MLPWKSIIQIQKQSDLPVYLQIANSIIKEIKQGVIKPGSRMPGTRVLAEATGVHRKTIVNAYDELLAQDWLTSVPSKGTFVNQHLPEMHPVKLSAEKVFDKKETTGFKVKMNHNIHDSSRTWRHIMGFHDGPDVRLVPVEQISKAYRSVFNRKSSIKNFTYVNTEGHQVLRKVLSEYLNDTRGLQTTMENIFITRGSQMGFYLLSKILIEPGDHVIVAETSYKYIDLTFENLGGKLIRIPVDDNGIDVDQIEKICQRKKIRAVYVTPHHHYPTTVTLTAARRMKLLSLAEKYGFIIIEDDYDYDFHYQSAPILPLASADRKGLVIYIGTLSKTLAPSLRIGYIVAPKNLMVELSRMRQIIDVQGDPFLEQAVAELFIEGEIRRHMKKVLKEYHKRRDYMCSLLKDKLNDVMEFKVPDGGLAIWAKFDNKIPLPEMALRLRNNEELIISPGLIFNTSRKKLNSTRLGFGWMNIREIEKSVKLLNEAIRKKYW
ncbi:MAG TPA: GntR family transcriptional regulator [Bacteroidetes bacterium]|nr:GntR family transcriptional regulator [Bacteroidota bacterium]